MRSDIWAIILAAGESTRMGSPKMLLDFNGCSMLERVIRSVEESETGNIMVVLGAYRDELEKIVKETTAACCYNSDFKEGMLSSVKCGFRNIPETAEAVLVFQGDQPLISAKTINMVIETYRNSEAGIVIPLFNKRRGHPLLIRTTMRDEIEKLDPEKGLRSLAEKFPDAVIETETGDPGILRDFDTFEEYCDENNQIR